MGGLGKDPKYNPIVFGISKMISDLGENLWSSILEPYLDFIGIGAVMIGFLKTISLLSQSLSNLFLGGISDKIGRKKPIIFSFAVASIAAFILGYTGQLIPFALLMIVLGLTQGICTPSIMAAISESTPKQKRGAAFGVYHVFIFTPMLFGSLFGGTLASVFGYQTLFNLHSLLAIVAMAITYFFVVEMKKNTKDSESLRTVGKTVLFALPETFKFLREFKSYTLLMLAFTVHGFAYLIGTSFWALYAAKEIGLAIALVGFVVAGRNLGHWLVAVPSGRLTDRIGGWPMITLHIILTTPIMILYVFSPSFLVAVIISFISGVIGSLDGPAKPVVYAKMVGEKRMGTAIGISEFFVVFGRMMGPIAAGILWSYIGAKSPFYVSGFLNLISLVPLVIAWRYDTKSLHPSSE